MKKLVIPFIAASIISLAQEIPNTSYFMYNKLLYNPASAGTGSSQLNAAVMGRFQWSDIKGAPFTSLFWSDFKIPAYRMGLGVTVYQDRVGTAVNTDFAVNYSYYINITEKLKLSMGLRAGVTNAFYSTSNLNAWNNSDELLGNSYNANLPKFGTGFQLYSSKLYLSLSAPDIVTIDNQNVFRESNQDFFARSRTYVLMAGYRLKLSDQYALAPNVYASYHKFSGYRADMNLLMEITDYFWAGGTYSTTNNITLMAGCNISSRIKFGYAYQFKNGTSSTVSLFTHEVNLMVTFDNLFAKKTE